MGINEQNERLQYRTEQSFSRQSEHSAYEFTSGVSTSIIRAAYLKC